MRKIASILVVLLMLTGCASVYRQYKGPQLSDDKIAVLEHPDALHSYFIIEDVDGKWRGLGMIERYELLPGEHSITCSLHNPLKTSKKVTVYFKAGKGKQYVAEALTNGKRWTVQIRNKESNKIVSYYK
jgi:hypothetical protein